MNKGICVYAAHHNGFLEGSAAELVTAANRIKEHTGETVQVLVAAQKADALIEQLKQLTVDEIYLLPLQRDVLFQDDAMGEALAQAVRAISPSTFLVPAISTAKSLFSRVAAILGCGMTADCTDIGVDKREDGSAYLRQNKPSYGDNVMVSIVTRKGLYPQMLTVRPGVFVPDEQPPQHTPEVNVLKGIEIPDSRIQVLEVAQEEVTSSGIVGAQIVVVGGRGALENDNLELLRAFAKKLGAPLAGTRPLADTEVIAFEDQIGQTGATIRPKICLSFGVSGAIQHVEGIKDTKLYIAVNPDASAPIYHYADYGVARDMKGILQESLSCEGEDEGEKMS